jgi:hypothetical protein
MRGIALNLRRLSILDGNQDSASIRTIVRARGMNNLLHEGGLYDFVRR